jgi:hypothetical protein
VLDLVDEARCAYRASGQGSDDHVERLQGHAAGIWDTHPCKECQIQDGPCFAISPEQNRSHDPEQSIHEEFECGEEE